MQCLPLLSSRRWVCALSGSVHGRTGEFREAHSIAATPACEATSEYTPSLRSSPRMDACLPLDCDKKSFKRKPRNTSFVIEIFVDGLFN